MRVQSLIRSVPAFSRALSTSSARSAATPFRFPAMSPTMTEGGIASWKLKEGDSFSAGDVILEIETDKATIDVESTEDGILGKILRNDGEKGIQVGELIAILAEEGDDLSSLSADAFESGSPDTSPPSKEAAVPEVSTSTSSTSSSPSSSSSSSPSSHHAPTIKHAQPISPSVQRILLGSSLTTEQISALKGSGMRGALTKGDVLKAIGAIKNVWGSKEAETLETEGRKGVSARYKLPESSSSPQGKATPPPPPQDPLSLRRAVLRGFAASTLRASTPASTVPAKAVTFDDILADYGLANTLRASQKPLAAAVAAEISAPTPAAPAAVPRHEYDGLF